MQRLFQAAVIATILGGNAWAQDNAPIERIRMTDNELSCGQIYGESQKMDKVIAEASNSQSTNQSAGVVANVAGQAATSGVLGGFASRVPFGGLFGQAMASGAQQVAANNAQASAERTQQASARKQHLTSMFLAKNCKLSELQQPPAAPPPALPGASAPEQPKS